MARRIGIIAGITLVASFLGIAATALLILGVLIEWKLFQDPNWPRHSNQR